MNNSEPERQWLSETLTRQIPLGQAMQLSVARLDHQGIVLSAPLAPNVNDKGTAFGGALVSMMILAGWSLPRVLLRRHDLKAELVIGRCQVHFSSPVDQAFQAVCEWPEQAAIDHFLERLQQQHKGSIDLRPRIVINDEVTASLMARYVAVA